MNRKLTLIGAGPGSPDLITIKGARALAEADVVLYDALISKELLQYTRQKAIRINVGKRKNNHTFPQEEINNMIVHFARKGSHVVRLKGGDPFVFGRGIEELEYAASKGIPVEYVPGITSAIAVPGNVGIAMTQRGVNTGFAIVTATGKNGVLSANLKETVKTNLPVVILMGIHKLDQILTLYQDNGKGRLPVAVISKGTLPDEEIITGTVENLLSRVSIEEIASPGIIVIGEVVDSINKVHEISGEENAKPVNYEY